MPVVAIVGGQWGDEGKGKVVDLLAERAHMVVRYSGGSNAGHTIVNDLGTFRLHLIPSGIFHPKVSCLIGNGVALDPAVLLREIEELTGCGVKMGRLYISDRAHLVMPYHTLIDKLEEEARGGGAIGTTLRGIGPAYADKIARQGLRTCDLLSENDLRQQLRPILEQKNRLLARLYEANPLDLDEIAQLYIEYGHKLAPYIRDTGEMARQAVASGQRIVLEGAQGTMLDVDFGTYPYVTSCSPSIGGALTGLGLAPSAIAEVVAVFKAYTTRVGSGPLPTELADETGQLIREHAQEFGATTGRPRRCGWFDAVVARYAAQVNGCTAFAITRLDVLDILPKIKVCVSYEAEGKRLSRPPASTALMERCTPIYEEMEGWREPITDIRRFADLPRAAQAYVRRLEELTGCPAAIISVGPRREETIEVRPLF
ncbi:MAG: adenylosuccinate synthase [Chloroflexi bacterium]|nr:adenylosuccinate synthase [Chloroflexota bacterium]